MSVEISDGTNVYTWSAPSDLELTFRAGGSESTILKATKEGMLVGSAYTNASDPSNPGYEMIVAGPTGALQRIKGNFASFQSLLAASGLGSTGIDLPAIQRNQTALTASIAELSRTVAELSTSSARTAALVGGTDLVTLANTVALLRDKVNRLSSVPSATVDNNTIGLTIGGIALLALGGAVAYLYFRKR